MNKLSFKLGMFIFIFMIIVEAILFFFLYKSLADNRIEEVMDNLLSRGNSHRDVLEKRFDESTLNHVALMESEAKTIVVITDYEKSVLAKSEPVNESLDSMIHSNISEITHKGLILHDEWKENKYVATVSPIRIDGNVEGFVYMFANTAIIKGVIKELSNQFMLAGIITLFLTVFAIFILSHFITRPLVRMKLATEELMKGNMKVSLGYKRSDELGQLSNSIVILAGDLERLKEERKEFLASISHELRTPITYIKGYANIASREKISDQEREKYLRILKEESEHLTLLIKNLFELAKMDQNQFVIYKENVYICEIIQKVKEKMTPIFKDKQISFELKCEPDLQVAVDSERFHQVLINLIDNAINHSGELSKVRLHVEQSKPGLITISISDDGNGIPKEELPFIFERLYRVDKSRSRSLGGSGLGLSIVKEIIEKHGGQVHAESNLEKGTTISIELQEDG
ncbi:sensor histidine kinase [Pontibacillus marinus]|uniref:histidine kinase n=1 Tax=Pontibacillus marinus BH030004 = DSM 16465 TaxID=1385511 RepID=A0A0A5GJT8_9BACI|nr:HAMP domain-containing sensor histidine kinase [Pontibacillus marinus]KGX91473.1 sensor histidine kinase [Pontibacillus marinus BH030004 = DSM 16465]